MTIDALFDALSALAERRSTAPFYTTRIRRRGQAAIVTIWETSYQGAWPCTRVVRSYQTTSRAADWSARQALHELNKAKGR